MTEKEVFESIKFHKLKRCKEFEQLTVKEFSKIYNGYGPDAWPTSMRGALTWVFGNFREVSGAHDIDFFFSDGTRSGFNATVRRWAQNSSIMLGARYPFSSPTLWIHRAVAWSKLYLARRAIGSASAYKFYVQAYKRSC
jgi:hypothetical protein